MGVLGVNHIAFRTPDPARLRAFYAELLGAEPLDGSHEPLRAGATLLVFFESGANTLSEDPDEIAFDVDAPGFDETLERARALDAVVRDPVAHTPYQLRGRVGRGEAASYCVLVSDSMDETAQARLKAVTELHDGFELAERDWELRREGNVLGLVQSGLPRLRVASLQRDDHRSLAVEARAAAEAMLDEAGSLRPGLELLDNELRQGWLARVAEAEPAGAA